jgi:hypothetical protein
MVSAVVITEHHLTKITGGKHSTKLSYEELDV